MLGSTIHSCHTLLTHSYIMSYIVIHCHAMTYIVRKSLLRSNGIWFHTMLFWTLLCCAPPSIKYSVWLMCACTVSWYVCHTLYRWIWYLYGRIGRVDGCGINTAHYPVFGRWSPWVGLIYWSDDQSIPLIPLFLVLVYFQCAQYTSQMAKVCLSFPLPSLLPERLMEPGATKSRSPGAEQATQVCVYLIVTHTAEPFLQAATLISIG